MKISKKIWVSSHVKWNRLTKSILCKKHYYKGHAYFICTSPQKRLLFEIVETRWLSSWYADETVLAICYTREEALEATRKLIDGLYNTQTLTYAELIE